MIFFDGVRATKNDNQKIIFDNKMIGKNVSSVLFLLFSFDGFKGCCIGREKKSMPEVGRKLTNL